MARKRIRISMHARFEMGRRRITESDIEDVIRNPGQIVSSGKGREIYQSKLGVRGTMLLRVIVKVTASAYHVVTAYKTSKVDKYWRKP